MVPSLDWFIYTFVRKEAVLSSQIEGTQATLVDLLTFEVQADAGPKAPPNADVEEVCNCLDALAFARAELADPRGLPLSMRLSNETTTIAGSTRHASTATGGLARLLPGRCRDHRRRGGCVRAGAVRPRVHGSCPCAGPRGDVDRSGPTPRAAAAAPNCDRGLRDEARGHDQTHRGAGVPARRILLERIHRSRCAPGLSRTANPRLRRPVLYPVELRAQEANVCRGAVLQVKGEGGKSPSGGRSPRRPPPQ